MNSDKNDQFIPDCYAKSLDILLSGRKAQIYACRSLSSRVDQSQSTKLSDYCMKVISPWRSRPTLPLFVDIFLVCEPLKELVLIERWLFRFNKEDTKDSRAISNRRIQTFIRSLYSFVRLLPGFQQLTMPSMPAPGTLYFDAYCPDMHDITKFRSAPGKQHHIYIHVLLFKLFKYFDVMLLNIAVEYKFPVVTALNRSTLSVSVHYLPPAVIQVCCAVTPNIKICLLLIYNVRVYVCMHAWLVGPANQRTYFGISSSK